MDNGTHIATLTKKSRQVKFVADADDAFMINVLTVNGSNVTHQALIIRTDLQQWINYYKTKGYV